MQATESTTSPARSRRTATQPLEAAALPDSLLKISTVQAITGLSAATLYRLAKSGELVPLRRGTRCTRWRSLDVTTWLRAQGAA